MWQYIYLSTIQPLNQLTDAHDTSSERYAIGRYPKIVLMISCYHSKEHCGLAKFCSGGGEGQDERRLIYGSEFV